MEAQKRLKIIIEGEKESNTVSSVCKKYGISRDTYYRWKKELLEAASSYWDEKAPGRKAKDHFETKSDAEKAYNKKKQELTKKEKDIKKLKKELEGTTIQRDFYRMRLKHCDPKKNSMKRKNDG